jgi:hypothetical protein
MPARVELGTSPRHLEREGLEPEVQGWEDGLRTALAPGTYEWWYFDVHADDGTLIVVVFFTKPMLDPGAPARPFVNVRIVTPDGVTRRVEAATTPEEFRAATDRCDVAVGPSRAWAEAAGYRLRVEVESVRCDLVFAPTCPPWRPGTGKFHFGPGEESYFAWVAPMPGGRVHGECVVDGQRRLVEGTGYHDHNWGTIGIRRAWSSWWWSRARIGDHTALAAELTATPAYGGQKLTLLMIADTTRILVADAEAARLTCGDERVHRASGKRIPGRLTYRLERGDTAVALTLTHGEDVFSHSFVRKLPAWKRVAARLLRLDPWYLRFLGHAELTMRDAQRELVGAGEAVYEWMSLGRVHRRHLPASTKL